MDRYKRMPILFFLVCYLLQTQAQNARTFYVGHSLSDQIPDMVQSLSNDHTNVDFSWVYQSIPGAPLRWQWDRKEVKDYTPIEPNYYGFYDEFNGLPSGNFDILVLTESVPRYSENISETYEYVDSFYRFAANYNPNMRVFLYEDWHCLLSGTPTDCAFDVNSNPWRQRLEDDLPMWESVVDTLNLRFNPSNPVCMIPAGQGLAALYDSIQIGVVPGISNIEELFSDDIHLNDIGKYFIACIHFAMIHETSPVGLTNQTQYWWGGDFDPPSSILALKFQEMAWQIVNQYPRTCLKNLTSTNQVSVQESLTITPNPTSDRFVVVGLDGTCIIEVLDAVGRVCKSFSTTTKHIEIDIESLPGGLYFIKIEEEGSSQIRVEKVLKQG